MSLCDRCKREMLGDVPFPPPRVEDLDVHALSYVEVKRYLQAPEFGGVYFALAKDRICYIGEAANLFARWHHHPLLARLEVEPEARIAWIAINYKVQRRQFERAAIARFTPLWNKGGAEYWDYSQVRNCTTRALEKRRAIKRNEKSARKQAERAARLCGVWQRCSEI